MKQTIITLSIVGTILTILAFSNSDNKSEGAIGDVKYSILPPDKFKEENGNGWFLMDDKVPIQGSTLNIKHGITEIPDVRGLFIRSLNLNRADDKSDPFIKENPKKEQRKMGDYQNDAFQDHRHDIYIKGGNLQWANEFQGTSGNVVHQLHPTGTVSKDKETKVSIEETRPKNTALYTYIKINE